MKWKRAFYTTFASLIELSALIIIKVIAKNTACLAVLTFSIFLLQE